MVWVGVAAIAGGSLQFQAFCRRLQLAERPPLSSLWFALGIAWALALTGLVLGVALLG